MVLVGDIKRLRDEGAAAEEAAYGAAQVRLRAILTAALVAAFGFIPMAIGSGAGAEVQRPLATVVVGGLVTATLCTLILLPTIYAWLFGGADRGREGGAERPRREELEPQEVSP